MITPRGDHRRKKTEISKFHPKHMLLFPFYRISARDYTFCQLLRTSNVAMRLWMEMMFTIFSPFPWRGWLPFALSLLGLGCGHLVYRQISCWICQWFKEWQFKKTRTWVLNGLRNRTISPPWTACNTHFWTLLWVKNKCYIWPLHLGFFCFCNLACTLTNFQRSP